MDKCRIFIKVFFYKSVKFSLYSANIMFLKHEFCIKWMLYCSQVKISQLLCEFCLHWFKIYLRNYKENPKNSVSRPLEKNKCGHSMYNKMCTIKWMLARATTSLTKTSLVFFFLPPILIKEEYHLMSIKLNFKTNYSLLVYQRQNYSIQL